jgi:hypothetical protein
MIVDNRGGLRYQYLVKAGVSPQCYLLDERRQSQVSFIA